MEVGEAIITNATRAMASLGTFWGIAEEGPGYQPVDVLGHPESRTAERYLQMTVIVFRGRLEHLPAAKPGGSAPGKAPDTAKVAHLVKAFPAGHRVPVFLHDYNYRPI